MPQYTRPLGDAVKRARGELGVTQRQVAEAADVDVRTVLNIENYKGNPKLEVLYPLIRSLKIDSREVFYPELLRDSPGLRRLRFLVEGCSEEEAALFGSNYRVNYCCDPDKFRYQNPVEQKRACTLSRGCRLSV